MPLDYIPLHSITFHYIPFHYIPLHSIPLHSITLLSITFHNILYMFMDIYVYSLMPPKIPMAGSMLRMGSVQPSPIPRRRGWWFSGGTIGIWNKLQVTGSKKFMMFMDVDGCLWMFIWLVVWNMLYFSFHIWDNPSHWRTHIFQRGRSTTNQESFDLTIFITWEVQLRENLRFLEQPQMEIWSWNVTRKHPKLGR